VIKLVEQKVERLYKMIFEGWHIEM
jgi:hypothetical protein